MRGFKQQPGNQWTFSCGHSCMLPALGVSTESAIWHARPSTKSEKARGNVVLVYIEYSISNIVV